MSSRNSEMIVVNILDFYLFCDQQNIDESIKWTRSFTIQFLQRISADINMIILQDNRFILQPKI